MFQVTIIWKGHFINAFHVNNKLLHEVEDHHLDIDPDYEVRTGMPPLVRSVQAIPNVNGIIR